MTQGQRLAADAAAAAEVRSYQTDPDVVALRVERIRTQVERLMWTGMVLGLCCTMVNVHPRVRIAVGCSGGRHRSVVIADAVAARGGLAGVGAEAEHRHSDRPVVER